MGAIFFGDSITAAENCQYNEGYCYLLDPAFINEAISGTTIGEYSIYPVDGCSLSSIYPETESLKCIEEVYLEYGVNDVCLSTLALVDNTGVRGKIPNPLTEEEIAKLQASAEKLKAVINQIEF